MPKVTQLIELGFKLRLPVSKAHKLTTKMGFTGWNFFFCTYFRTLSR